MDRVYVIFRRGIGTPDVRVVRIDLGSDDYKLTMGQELQKLASLMTDFTFIGCMSESQEIVMTRDEFRTFLDPQS